jgi:peptidoglycan/xylan/chitin deacetylase (PgdA/CDA1 family)
MILRVLVVLLVAILSLGVSTAYAEDIQAATTTTTIEPTVPTPPTPATGWWSVSFVKSRYRGVNTTHVHVKQKVVALTFDDGPNDGTTQRIVDILNQYGAKGTFFFRGRGMKPADILAVSESGNEIGNHTISHTGLTGQSTAVMNRELDRVNNQIEKITGQRPVWVRAKAGSISRRGLQAVRAKGMFYANWNVHSKDTNWSLSQRQITRNVVRGVKPGAIVLMHQTRPATIDALPSILAQLSAQGYKFVTLSELAAMGRP